MAYTNPVPTREAWQKLRDTNKVPKGAAKVSIGDAIAKVHKSFSPTSVDANVKDTKQLIKDLDAYINTVKAKHPSFEAVVKKDVKKKAEDHLRFMEDIVKARVEYYPRYSAALEEWKGFKTSGKGKLKDVAAKLQRLKGCVDAFAMLDTKWEAKRPQVQKIFQLCDTAASLNPTQSGAVDTLFVDLKPS